MWCFHLGVQTPINPFHHCFTILGMTMMMVMVMMVMVMRLGYKQNIHPLYPCSTILLMNTIDWFLFFYFGILYQDCDIGIYFVILFFLIIHSLQKIISTQKWQECTFVNNRQYDRTFFVLNNSANPKTQRRRYISPLF